MFVLIVVVSVLAMTAFLAATGGGKENGLINLLRGRWDASEVFLLIVASLVLGGGIGVVLATGILRHAQHL